jgi:hypothetical protein
MSIGENNETVAIPLNPAQNDICGNYRSVQEERRISRNASYLVEHSHNAEFRNHGGEPKWN